MFRFINESDFYSKREEFRAWLHDIKSIEMETLPIYKQKEFFREYRDDYNTATLPNEKYYNMAAWEAEQLRKGENISTAGDPMADFNFNDEDLVCTLLFFTLLYSNSS